MSGDSAALLRVAASLPRQLRDAQATRPGPLLVSGPPSATRALVRGLTRDGRPGLVLELGSGGDSRALTGASALVHVMRGPLTPTDEALLRAADRRRVPLVCLVLGEAATPARVLPYVRATDVIRSSEVDGAAIGAVARAVAGRAADIAWALSADLPVLAGPAARALVRRTAIRSALTVALPREGPDLPVLASSQLGLVARLATASAVEPSRVQAPALAGVAGVALALRAIVRRAGAGSGLSGQALRSGAAIAGTAAIGAAVIVWLERSGGAAEVAGRLRVGIREHRPGSGERDLGRR